VFIYTGQLELFHQGLETDLCLYTGQLELFHQGLERSVCDGGELTDYTQILDIEDTANGYNYFLIVIYYPSINSWSFEMIMFVYIIILHHQHHNLTPLVRCFEPSSAVDFLFCIFCSFPYCMLILITKE